MRSSRTALIVLLAILFLFFFQVLSDFIQSIYAFGLLVTAFTIQLAAVLLLFSPVVLLFVRRVPSRPWMVGLAAVAVLGRLFEPLLDPGGRLVACGISVGAFMLLWPIMLAALRPAGSVVGWSATWGLLIAVMLSITFRTAGSGLDISEVSIFQLISWMLAVLAGRLVWTLAAQSEIVPPGQGLRSASTSSGGERPPRNDPASLRSDNEMATAASLPRNDAALTHAERREASLRSLAAGPQSEIVFSGAERAPGPADAGSPLRAGNDRGRIIGLCIGLAAVVVMLYFAFVSPTVIARWTGYSYPLIVGVLVIVLLALGYFLMRPGSMQSLSRPLLLTWNALFVAMLVLTIMPHQVALPAGSDPYPMNAPVVSPLWQIPLYLMLLLSPIIFVDWLGYVRGLTAEGPSMRQLGGGFALGALFILVMVFLQVFTTIYDYARPIGPLLRDRFWVVYAIAGMALGLPTLSIRGGLASAEEPAGRPEGTGRFAFGAAGALAILTGLGLWLTTPRPPQVAAPTESIQVMTYNIQQGFDKVGNAALPEQLAAIRHVQPDILGLEESDTARVANGNVDAVRYFASNLGMYSYYGPTTTAGTFGIALLSRYPIERAWTFYMYSTGEQTACIEAVITANGKTYNVFVTHLGNGGPMIQLIDVLNRVDGLPNVILMGDFNFDPSTEQYALATRTLADAWLLNWPSGRQGTGPGAEGRIDQILVSPDMDVTYAEYVPNPASDHPYLYVVIGRR